MGQVIFILNVIIFCMNVCFASPISDISRKGNVAQGGYSELNKFAGLLSIISVFCLVLLIGGCVCCGFKKFKWKSLNSRRRNRSSNWSAIENNGQEVSIFPPPLAQNYLNSEVYIEPLPDIGELNARNGSKFLSHQNEVWFSEPHKNFPRNQLQYVRSVGVGYFGHVLEGRAVGVDTDHTSTVINCSPTTKKTPVVVKILREDASAQEQTLFLQELLPYRDLKHANILRIVAYCLEAQPLLVLFEQCSKGDLKNFLKKNQSIPDRLLVTMGQNVAAGLEFMHRHNFIHTDLAARNCLVEEDFNVKIGDYGCSLSNFKDEYYLAENVALPLRWCAPETLKCSATIIETVELTKEANVWSFGVVLWELLSRGSLPYADMDEDSVIHKVILERSRSLSVVETSFDGHVEELSEILRSCFAKSSARSTMSDLLTKITSLSDDSVEISDFDERWHQFRTNRRSDHLTEATLDSHASYRDESEVRRQQHLGRMSPTPSLKNFHGSAEDLSEKIAERFGTAYPSWMGLEPGQPMDSLTEEISDAIQKLDEALSDGMSGSASTLASPVKPGVRFKMEENSLISNHFWPKSCPSEGEEENFSLRIEQGEFSELAKIKSQSVHDFMTLTVVDDGVDSPERLSQPGSFTLESTPLVANNSITENVYNSESNLPQAIRDAGFMVELEKIQAERKYSIISETSRDGMNSLEFTKDEIPDINSYNFLSDEVPPSAELGDQTRSYNPPISTKDEVDHASSTQSIELEQTNRGYCGIGLKNGCEYNEGTASMESSTEISLKKTNDSLLRDSYDSAFSELSPSSEFNSVDEGKGRIPCSESGIELAEDKDGQNEEVLGDSCQFNSIKSNECTSSGQLLCSYDSPNKDVESTGLICENVSIEPVHIETNFEMSKANDDLNCFAPELEFTSKSQSSNENIEDFDFNTKVSCGSILNGKSVEDSSKFGYSQSCLSNENGSALVDSAFSDCSSSEVGNLSELATGPLESPGHRIHQSETGRDSFSDVKTVKCDVIGGDQNDPEFRSSDLSIQNDKCIQDAKFEPLNSCLSEIEIKISSIDEEDKNGSISSSDMEDLTVSCPSSEDSLEGEYGFENHGHSSVDDRVHLCLNDLDALRSELNLKLGSCNGPEFEENDSVVENNVYINYKNSGSNTLSPIEEVYEGEREESDNICNESSLNLNITRDKNYFTGFSLPTVVNAKYVSEIDQIECPETRLESLEDAKDSLILEDLESVDGDSLVTIGPIAPPQNSDDVLVVDTETNNVTLVDSGRPQSHLAFLKEQKPEHLESLNLSNDVPYPDDDVDYESLPYEDTSSLTNLRDQTKEEDCPGDEPYYSNYFNRGVSLSCSGNSINGDVNFTDAEQTSSMPYAVNLPITNDTSDDSEQPQSGYFDSSEEPVDYRLPKTQHKSFNGTDSVFDGVGSHMTVETPVSDDKRLGESENVASCVNSEFYSLDSNNKSNSEDSEIEEDVPPNDVKEESTPKRTPSHLPGFVWRDSQNPGDTYTADWETDSEADIDSSSTSGEFVWQPASTNPPVEDDAPRPTPEGDPAPRSPSPSPSEDSSESGEEEFTPSTWNRELTPRRSLLKSPETNSLGKKSVRWKRQRHHRVYEYPPEPRSWHPEIVAPGSNARRHWSPRSIDFLNMAEWNLKYDEFWPGDSEGNEILHATALGAPDMYHIDPSDFKTERKDFFLSEDNLLNNTSVAFPFNRSSFTPAEFFPDNPSDPKNPDVSHSDDPNRSDASHSEDLKCSDGSPSEDDPHCETDDDGQSKSKVGSLEAKKSRENLRLNLPVISLLDSEPMMVCEETSEA